MGIMKPLANPQVEENAPSFITAGKEISKIDVQISYRIIELFSEGLYRSPHKAIEELICNAFDAGATKTHVVISSNLSLEDATIAVIDNGTSMDEAGLRQHWLIGITNKRERGRKYPKNRKQIGKFGIGKLSTFVLASYLTHICKTGGKYYAASMNFDNIPTGVGGGIYTKEKVQLPLRQLTETQARMVLEPWLKEKTPGYTEIKLFGSEAEKNWTVTIMYNLKDMARQIQFGKLCWVMSTAMPLRDDFQLYLNGDLIKPSKLRGKKYGMWKLGLDLKEIPKPAPSNLQVFEENTQEKSSTHRFGLIHPELGRITGYAELYENLLTNVKSEEMGNSYGFFVYLRERLVNEDDEYFGIDSNLLRHGTFGRFRMVVHVDKLDDDLRSSRESISEGPLVNITRNILQGVFSYVRAKHQEIEAKQAPGVYATGRIAASPASLTRRPLVGLVIRALKGEYSPMYLCYPKNLSSSQQTKFIDEFKKKADTPEGLVSGVQIVENLSQDQGIALFDSETGILQINALHPYVAHFLEEYENKQRNEPLDLLAMSEVLLEANLLEIGIDTAVVADVISQRDELLRHLSRSTRKRSAISIAQDLLDASTDKSKLETELVAAFESLGFDDVTTIGGKSNPDGLAKAHLSANKSGASPYVVTIEAKSKKQPGTKVAAKQVGISDIVRHRKKYNANYAVVVGPDFPTTKGGLSALGEAIQEDREKNHGKGITLIRIDDMARLIRLAPAKLVGLDRLRELFEKCSTPEQSKEWIDKLEAEKMRKRPPYSELLEAISEEQKAKFGEVVEFGNVQTCLRTKFNLSLEMEEVISYCKALSKIVPEYVTVRARTVEIRQRPDIILDAARQTFNKFPAEEQKTILKPE